jgi:hypothetical protein
MEVLADRASARLYGARSFEKGLRHVVRRQIEFNYFASTEIQEAFNSGRALQNSLDCARENAEEAIDHAIDRQTSKTTRTRAPWTDSGW